MGFARATPEVTLREHGELAGRTIATLEYFGSDGRVLGTKALQERSGRADQWAMSTKRE